MLVFGACECCFKGMKIIIDSHFYVKAESILSVLYQLWNGLLEPHSLRVALCMYVCLYMYLYFE